MSGTKFCYEEAKDNCFRFERVLPSYMGESKAGVAGQSRQNSIADCQNKCFQVPGCQWFSYNSRTRDKNCLLRSMILAENDDRDGVYGPKKCSGLNANCTQTKLKCNYFLVK